MALTNQKMPVEIGIDESSRKEIAEGLTRFLADTYLLYFKTHNFHWNVSGPMFQTLHVMFEVQYQDLWLTVDEIAERIRALGVIVPSYSKLGTYSTVKEEEGDKSSEDMIRSLIDGHSAVLRTARSVFPNAEEAGDQSTLDLLTQRMRSHEKTAWMLRSLLEDRK